MQLHSKSTHFTSRTLYLYPSQNLPPQLPYHPSTPPYNLVPPPLGLTPTFLLFPHSLFLLLSFALLLLLLSSLLGETYIEPDYKLCGRGR